MKTKYITRAIIGMIVIAVGVNFVISLNMGMASFDMLAMVILDMSPVEKFGDAILLIHLTFITFLICGWKYFKMDANKFIMSMLSIVLITRFINLLGFIQAPTSIAGTSKLLLFVVSVLITNAGVYLLLKSNFVVTPYDRFVLQLSTVKGWSIGSLRWIFDISTLVVTSLIIVCFNLPITISIFTVLIIISIGPTIIMLDRILKLD